MNLKITTKLMAIAFIFSVPLFASDTLCYTMTGDAGLVSDITGFALKDVGEGNYTITKSYWKKVDGTDQISNTELGTFACRFQSGSPNFDGLFTCKQPEDPRTLEYNVIHSKIVESPYVDRYTGEFKTIKSFQMDSWLSGTGLAWDRAKCSNKDTFQKLVEYYSIIR